jgi:hypothetical protein
MVEGRMGPASSFHCKYRAAREANHGRDTRDEQGYQARSNGEEVVLARRCDEVFAIVVISEVFVEGGLEVPKSGPDRA